MGRQAPGPGVETRTGLQCHFFDSGSSVRLGKDSEALRQPLLLPGTLPPAPELTQATSSRFLRVSRRAERPGMGGAQGAIPRAAHAPRDARAFAVPQERETTGRVNSGCPGDSGPTGAAPESPVPATGLRARGGLEPRTSQTPALSPYLQQLHVARWEPAAEPVLLLAFPPAAVRDLQQGDQLACSKA